ncbi:hypothetical protein, partial [Xanthomonas nasturtii]|uniref:hypothetical protein n=1 Tax=Xanthomonas nasturtii TaxID=1843581 RepID=UPI00201236AB
MRGSYLQRALAQAPESPEVLAAADRVCRSAGKNRKAEQYFVAPEKPPNHIHCRASPAFSACWN